MLTITSTKFADTRHCDYTTVTKRQLSANSLIHTKDVLRTVEWLCDRLREQAKTHDHDKLSASGLELFHQEFITGMATTEWLDNHYQVNRHHLETAAGVRDDVNLLDVLECVVDCVVAGLARNGTRRPVDIPTEVLQRAVANTVKLLTYHIEVKE